MVELESLSFIFLFENKPYDAAPVWKFRRMDLDMGAGKLLCAILFGIINQIVTSAEILVMATYSGRYPFSIPVIPVHFFVSKDRYLLRS